MLKGGEKERTELGSMGYGLSGPGPIIHGIIFEPLQLLPYWVKSSRIMLNSPINYPTPRAFLFPTSFPLLCYMVVYALRHQTHGRQLSCNLLISNSVVLPKQIGPLAALKMTNRDGRRMSIIWSDPFIGNLRVLSSMLTLNGSRCRA